MTFTEALEDAQNALSYREAHQNEYSVEWMERALANLAAAAESLWNHV